VTRLDALLALLPPDAPVVLGFSPAGGASLELVRSHLPSARDAALRTVIAAAVADDAGAISSSRRYLTTGPAPEAGTAGPTATLDIAAYHAWAGLVARQDARIAELERRLLEAEQSERERSALQELLLTAETELARVPLLLEAVDELRHDRDLRVAEVEHVRRVLAAVMGSLSWRITRPLRALKPRRR
jgi:hypothetical protein